MSSVFIKSQCEQQLSEAVMQQRDSVLLLLPLVTLTVCQEFEGCSKLQEPFFHFYSM